MLQVLPGRTHPAMQMSADGGFILTGVKTLKREDGWRFVEKTRDPASKKARVAETGSTPQEC